MDGDGEGGEKVVDVVGVRAPPSRQEPGIVREAPAALRLAQEAPNVRRALDVPKDAVLLGCTRFGETPHNQRNR